MNTQHTPGPWEAVQHPREHKWAWTIKGADEGGQIIAIMGLVNDAQAIAANAHLIAAAPAMYEALKECLASLEVAQACDGDVFDVRHNNTMDAMLLAETALAQAEGTNR